MSLGELLVVEDEQFTRTTLGVTLQALGFGVVGLCTSAHEALTLARTRSIDVALLDLDLGAGPSGIDIAHALRDVNPVIGIVLLTTFSDPRLHDPHQRELPVGARYLVKTNLSDPEVLRSTIVDARHLPLRKTQTGYPELILTNTQLEVLRLLAAGKSNTEIAGMQGVTDKAIERTVQRITEALGVSDQGGNKRVLLSRAYANLSGKRLPS